MQKPSDEMLVAYLDGEIGEAELAEVELCLERDQSVRDRVRELTLSGNLLRDAFDDLLDEPVPERLYAAATGRKALPADANVVAFRPRMTLSSTRSWISLAAAASLFGMIFGGSVTYLAAGGKGPLLGTSGDGQVKQSQMAAIDATTVNNSWLDNVAAYHNLLAAPAAGSDGAVFDIPATGDDANQKISQRIPGDLKIPDLKPWGLEFKGMRQLVVEGRPAAQLYYTTDNKALGPITVVIANSKRTDVAPTYDKRENMNLLYWRHMGKAYAIVGQADKGYMWGLANDIAWQLNAI
jgi:anti-sigma factor RsiW